MKNLSKTFLTGLAAVLPLLATGYLLYWLATTAESFLGRFIREILPEDYYLPGLGVAAGVVLVLVVGLLMHAWVVQRIFALSESLLCKIPLVNTIYGSFRDLLGFISSPEKAGFSQVVAVKVGNGVELIGFITRQDLKEFAAEGQDETIAVYLPMSYMIGGYTVLVPRSAVRTLDISREQAMRFALTGGVTRGRGTPAEASRSN